MQLEPDEVDLLGVWEFDGTHVRADSTCERIEFLTKNVLQRVVREHLPSSAANYKVSSADGGLAGGNVSRASEASNPSHAALR